MFRLLVIAVISLCSLVVYLVIFHRWLDLNDDLAGWISMALAWVVTPFVLLNVWQAKPTPDVIPIDVDDPIITDLIARSRAEIQRLIDGLSAGKNEAFIKFPYTFSGETEHVWGIAHSLRDREFIVSLDSIPVGEAPKEVYERLRINIDEVEDWMLIDAEGKVYGGYSMLGLAKVYTRDYGKLPKKYARDLENFVDFSWPE